jgi:hypothetical protein
MGILGGNDQAAAARRARREALVAADRQLAEQRAQQGADNATRRNPRGRRLFVSDPAEKTNLS